MAFVSKIARRGLATSPAVNAVIKEVLLLMLLLLKDLRNLASPGGGDWRRSDGSWYRPGRSSDGSQGHTGRHQPAGEPLDSVDIRQPDAFQVLDKSNARISESIKRVAKKKFADDAEAGEKFIDR